MCTLYDNIKVLCEEKGVRPSKMCVDIGISKGLISDLKVGRKKSIMIGTAQKIADNFLLFIIIVNSQLRYKWG